MRLFVLAVVITLVPCTNSEAAHRAKRGSEVHVEQAKGRLPPGVIAPNTKVKSAKVPNSLSNTPEGVAQTGVGSPTTPTTCNQQNASSPACYSATQQARPAAR